MAKDNGNAVYPTLADILDKCAVDHGDKAAIAVMDAGAKVSHAQLKVAVEHLGLELKRTGVKPGDLVSLAFPNTLEFVVAFLAVTRIRCVAAPLNAAYTEDEFRFYMEDASSTLLLLPAVKPSAPAQAAAASLNLPVALIHPLTSSDDQIRLTPEAHLKLTPEGEGTLGAGDRPTGDDEALFLHTSGTTSRPKGVPLSHTNLSASIGNIVKCYHLGSGDKSLVVMPLFHVHGLMAALLSTLAAGGTALLPSGGRFSASTFWKDIREGGATWYTAVPTMHQILLAKHKQTPEKEDIPRLRFIRSCSASLAPAVLAGLEEAFGAPVLEAYAMTEAAHQMCANPLPSEGPHKPGTVGKPTGIQLAILDAEGRQLPAGQVGEVCLTGPNVTKGYKNNPEANAACFTFDYFHTGDQGKVDADGYLELVGRIKELINRGGEKISPMEVDAALLAHPDVAEAVTFGAPDDHYGEEVNAAVMVHKGQTPSQEDIQAFLKKQLAPFKIPKRIFFTDEVPRTATGKIQRRFVAQVFLGKTVEGKKEEGKKEESPASASAVAASAVLDGNEIAALALARLGIRFMFGVVGIPITYFATAAQKAGIRFIAFRNEQAAGYAAGACGYLTGVPGALLTVSGPGCVHGLAGLSNAMINTWPMVMISGSSCQADVGKGDFQELDQLVAVKPFVKYAGKAKTLSDIPSVVETAIRASITGRPGGSYIDLPTDLLHQTLPQSQVDALLSNLKSFSPSWAHPPSPTTFSVSPPLPPTTLLQQAVTLLKEAKRPLLVIGKGAAYARAEIALSEFVGVTGIPFVATPMGKGVLPDTHPLSAGAARSLALSQSDVVLVVGARLNWMLHFGEEPKWGKGVKFVLVEVDGGEVEMRKPEVGLVGDAKAVVEKLNGMVKEVGVRLGEEHPWRAAIMAKSTTNTAKMASTLAADVTPLNFHCSLRIIRDAIAALGSPSPILVSEGANTMDVGRAVLEQSEARTRLDAGTWGTMGVGLGYAIGAAVTVPGRLVVAVEGDSAFGFSGMEMEVRGRVGGWRFEGGGRGAGADLRDRRTETIVRYDLPIVVIVMNNGGVYGGDRRGPVDIPEPYHNDPAPTSFMPGIKYDLLMQAFGGQGYTVETPAQLAEAVREAFSAKKPALINVTIDPFAGAESGGMTHRN